MLISDKKIKVLYVVENTTYGGGERGFGQLSAQLNRNHFLPHIAAHPGGIMENQANESGIEFFPLNMNHKLNLNTISKLTDLVNDNKINIVHSMGSRADFFARMACRNMYDVKNISTIAMLVEGYDVNLFRKAFYKLADCYSSKFVSHFIAVSNALKTKLILKRKIPLKKISVIYNGVELDKYNPEREDLEGLRQSLGIDDDCIVVGSIGRLVYQKGFQYFIEAADIIGNNNKTRFIIVGEGPEEKNLKARVKASTISDVFMFTGQRFDIPQILKICDIFVLPSILEGLPRVVIEAMAMAKPIVATDISGVREQLSHNHDGLIVPPKNPQALAEAITHLIDDKNKANELGKKARSSAELKFDLKQTVRNMERLYQNLLV